MLTTVSITPTALVSQDTHRGNSQTASSTIFAVHQHVPIFKMMQADVKTLRYATKQLENVVGLRQVRHSFSLEVSLLPLEDSAQQG